jgi:hypothetical protein
MPFAPSGYSRNETERNQDGLLDIRQLCRAQRCDSCPQAGFIDRSYLITQSAPGTASNFYPGFAWKERLDIAGNRKDHHPSPILITGIIGNDDGRSGLANFSSSRRIELNPVDITSTWSGFHSGHPSVSLTAQSSQSEFLQDSARAFL